MSGTTTEEPVVDDPVVAEVRQIRKDLAEKHGYGNDVKLFMKYWRELDAKSPRPHVSYATRKPTPMAYPQELESIPAMVVAEEKVEYMGDDTRL